MLNIIELSDISHYIETVQDEHIKKLLKTMEWEYREYAEVGDSKDCRIYKQLCDTPLSRFHDLLRVANESLIEEMDILKKENEELEKEIKNKKKGKKKCI